MPVLSKRPFSIKIFIEPLSPPSFAVCRRRRREQLSWITPRFLRTSVVGPCETDTSETLACEGVL